jgi:MFS family permease
MLATAFLMFGNSIFATLLALRANIEGYPNELIGLMASAYFLGFALGTFRSGPLINRIGHIRAFAALSALASACALLVLLIPNPWVWIALRATMGAAVAGLFIVVESWLNNRAANHSRGLLLSIYIMIGYLASTLGQQALKLGNPAGYELFLIVGVVLALSLVPVTLTHATHPDPVETPHLNLRRLFDISPTSVIACLGAGLIGSAWWGLGPVYALEIGFTINDIAGYMAAGLVGGMLLQLPIGKLSDHLDRRTVLAGVAVALVLPSAALIFGANLPVWVVLGSVALFYGLASTLYPLAIAYANDYLDPSEVVAASGGFILAYGVGAVIGPLASSVAMRLLGPGGMFVYIIATAVALVVFISWRMRIRQWVPVVEKEPYVLQPDVQAPGIVSDLDPRAEVDAGYDQGPDILKPPAAWSDDGGPFSFWLGQSQVADDDIGGTTPTPADAAAATGRNTGNDKKESDR